MDNELLTTFIDTLINVEGKNQLANLIDSYNTKWVASRNKNNSGISRGNYIVDAIVAKYCSEVPLKKVEKVKFNIGDDCYIAVWAGANNPFVPIKVKVVGINFHGRVVKNNTVVLPKERKYWVQGILPSPRTGEMCYALIDEVDLYSTEEECAEACKGTKGI